MRMHKRTIKTQSLCLFHHIEFRLTILSFICVAIHSIYRCLVAHFIEYYQQFGFSFRIISQLAVNIKDWIVREAK